MKLNQVNIRRALKMDEFQNHMNEHLKIVSNWLKSKDLNKWTIESLKDLIFNPNSEMKQYKCQLSNE